MTTSGPASRAKGVALAGLVLRLQLFFTAYAPLGLIFAFQSHTAPARLAWAGVFLVAVIAGVRLTFVQLRKIPVARRLSEVDDRGGEVAGYLASYLLPFIAGPPSGAEEIAAYCTYFLVAVVVFVRSTLVLINPTLYIFGWRVVAAKTGSQTMLLLCREVPRPGREIDLVGLLDGAVRKDRGSGRP